MSGRSVPSRRLDRLAIIAGERSGDNLGAGLIAALKARCGAFDLVGVGGAAMEGEGLVSLFDHEELSIVGIGAVLARLPLLLRRIRQTANAVIAARPDALVIIDSPAFTHRVARRVRAMRPDLPIINYVCPTVWAWKPERAAEMTGYVDHVLSILPFEPAVIAALGGPPVTYVGHFLSSDAGLASARMAQRARRGGGEQPAEPLCLLLPGSRGGELKRLMPDFARAAAILNERRPAVRFVLPTLPRHAGRLKAETAGWPMPVDVVSGEGAKWQAFGRADTALAASGTVLLELALAGVPCVSVYRLDPLARLMVGKITAWTAALPNMIADAPVVPEYFNEQVRPPRLARWIERLAADSPARAAMLDGFERVHAAMQTDRPPSETAAETVLAVMAARGGFGAA